MGRLGIIIPVTLFYLFRLFPVKKEKIIASSFKGRKFGDNPKCIIEMLHGYNKGLKFVWMKDERCDYDVPSWIKVVKYDIHSLRTIYELATSKVWIDSHRLQMQIRKRKNQLFVETWHGGLGIKKIEKDVDAFSDNYYINTELATTIRCADVFLSQSDHLTDIYKRAFGYKGVICKLGYPKNDILINSSAKVVDKVRSTLKIDKKRFLLYAPTFRDCFYENQDVSVYDVDFNNVVNCMHERFGDEWCVVVKWHPLFANELNAISNLSRNVINATSYADIQELLLAADAVMTDYSSCIFDAFLRPIPCFIYAKDFKEYKKERGVYYELDELPFPYARDNDELMANIRSFNMEDYLSRVDAFKKRTGLKETGHASEDIANRILAFINGEIIEWK